MYFRENLCRHLYSREYMVDSSDCCFLCLMSWPVFVYVCMAGIVWEFFADLFSGSLNDGFRAD